ncbi:MAG: SufE family protein [Bdellovibrionota bacterium]
MNVVTERQNKLIEEFTLIPNWEDRYKRVIEYGKQLPKMPPELYDEKFKVKGCQSQVWLHAGLNPDGTVGLQADSDALIVKGLVAVLVSVYANAKPADILAASPDFLRELGFEGHLSPSRANGLYAMLKQIMYYAQAFQALASLKR